MPRLNTKYRVSYATSPAQSSGDLLADGTYGTVAKTKLADAGSSRSTYSTRLRISRSGVFRGYIKGDVSNSTGTSASRRIRVH